MKGLSSRTSIVSAASLVAARQCYLWTDSRCSTSNSLPCKLWNDGLSFFTSAPNSDLEKAKKTFEENAKMLEKIKHRP